MASFVVTLADKQLRYGTISSYVWAVVDHHLSQGFASPLSNVRDWTTFMHSVEVETHVPAEGRRMLPWKAMVRVLRTIDRTVRWECGMGLLLLILLFTMSRPEILPKALTGDNSFDLGKHLARKHVRQVHGYIEVCFRSIKQDPLCKRPAIVEGEAWRAIGSCTGVLNVDYWLQTYLDLCSFTSPSSEEPLFLDDSGRVLTYARANFLLRELLQRVDGFTKEEAYKYALGGVRSLGYNAAKGVDGDETARIQGMWGSDAHMHYDRPMLERVLLLPAKLAQYAASATSNLSPLGAFEDSSSNLNSPSPPPPPAVPSDVPHGWTVLSRVTAAGRAYKVYVHDATGTRLQSLAAVHRWSPPAAPVSAVSSSSVPLPSVAPQDSPSYRLHPLTQPMWLHEIVVEGDRPSARRSPAKRARSA